MGNYSARRDNFLQGWQISVAELLFQGKTDDVIMEVVLGVKPTDDPKKVRSAKDKLRKLRRSEKFQEYYRSIITEWTVHNVGKALNRISTQVDSNIPWLANKAANDILNQSKVFMTGVDDNTVVIKMDGMPQLGSPEQEDD